MVSARHVAREAAKTVMSGPASGVMAAVYTARRAGIANLITYDMGGTSTDVALIQRRRARDLERDRARIRDADPRPDGRRPHRRRRRRLDRPASTPPASSRSAPSPPAPSPARSPPAAAAPRPTITDANLLLGRLDPARFPGPAHVRAIFADALGRPLGLTPEEAAAAVLRIADTRMANAIRMVSLSLGADPRDFTLFAFGGAGPLHAAALARELGLPRVLVPARPGITNALGCVVADLRHDFVRTLSRPLAALDIAAGPRHPRRSRRPKAAP